MSYQLRDEVSFCLAEGRFIFLDIRRDRYLCLGPAAGHAFSRLIDGIVTPEDIEPLRPLIAAGFLVPGENIPAPAGAASSIERSAVDEWNGAADMLSAIHMLAAQLIWRRIFKRHGLRGAICRIVRLKARASPPDGVILPRNGQRLVAGFLMAGRLFDNRDRCLLRSFTLVASLAKRGCAVDLMFGVRASPFGAHCWVQHGNLVLNDSVDHAQQFTPILVL